MLPHEFAYLAIVLNTFSGVSYLLAVLRKQAIPHPVTFGLWAALGLIIGLAQWAEGHPWPALITLVPSVFPLAIFILGFRGGKSLWKVTPLDYLCGVIAIAGVVGWRLTSNPFYAVLFSLVADFFASYPTFVKAYTHPHTEDGRAYAFNIAGWGLSLAICQQFTFVECASFVFNLASCLVFVGLIYRHRIVNIVQKRP